MLESSQGEHPTSVRDHSGMRTILRRRTTLIRGVSAAIILVAAVLLMRTLPTERLLELAENRIDSLGAWGPLALGVIYVVAVLLFIPGSILTLVAGAVYGLMLGTVIVSLASTTAAALAFLIARYVARDKVRRRIEQSPKLAAVDEAIGEQGWKIVALLRLSPGVPFSLQNYFYGVTAIRFWPCVVASWVAMLPGTFLYVYLGTLGKTAAAGDETSAAEWAARGVGLVAIVAVTVYLAKLARHAMATRTGGTAGENAKAASAERADHRAEESAWPWATLLIAALALVALGLALWATVRRDVVQSSADACRPRDPLVAAVEAHSPRRDGRALDHSSHGALLQRHVDGVGWIDYRSLSEDAVEPGVPRANGGRARRST